MDDRVRLRPAEEEDIPLIQRLTGDPEATGEYAWYGWLDPVSWRRRWEQTRLLADEGSALIVERAGEPLGFVSWRRQPTSRVSFCWNIGVAIRPEVRGHGYGAQAQRRLAGYLFAHTQANRVEAVTEITNLAEQRALEKAGFTREGVLRGYGFRDGAWRDGVIYSILRAEAGQEPAGDDTTPRPSHRAERQTRRDG